MRERKDFTRWNRAGLTRFRYVDGNAVEYLDLLRQRLLEQFADPKTGLCEWLNPREKIPAKEVKQENETLVQRQERLSLKQKRILETYHQDRRDWAWEITRTFARSCHILTEYADAYANEGYLGTATQWDHVRRLVEMLDYHPAPPASASTRLVFVAKQNKKGIVVKGFQVKHSPTMGGAKIVFETLEDLSVDSALNELRPKGWNQSDEPAALPPDNNGSTQPFAEEQQFSTITNGPAINIQGVGPVSAGKLDTLASTDGFKIKDFLDLDPDNSGLGIEATRLWEWKAKAGILITFAPEGDWSVIAEWLLPEIAEASADSLVELSGNSLEMTGALKLDIEIFKICLDHPVYEQTQLKELFAPVATMAGTVITAWHAKRKPKIVPDEVVMIYHEFRDENTGKFIEEAEAAAIAGIEKQTEIIYLTLSLVQRTWLDWKKSEVRLKVLPRWNRKCWLNGINVIRTEEPHGFSAGSYISWKVSSKWKYAKVIEADKRDIRLEVNGPLPQKGAEIVVARPLEGPNLPSDIEEEVGMETGELLSTENIDNITSKDLVDEKITPEFPSVISGGDTGSFGLGLIPGLFGKLPEVGSFIVPTPMLPMDLVKAAVKMLLKIGAMVIPSTGEHVFEFIEPSQLADVIYDLLSDSNVEWEDDETTVKNAIIQLLTQAGGPIILPSASDELVFFKKIAKEILQKGPFLVVPKNPPVKAIVDASGPLYMFNGKPDKIETGDWVIGRFTDGLRALKVSTINEFTDSDKSETFSLSFEKPDGIEAELKKVYAVFRDELIAEGAAVNNTEVDPEKIELDPLPESLKVGHEILLAADGKAPVAAKIESIDGNTIKTNPPATGFTKGNLVILGNVALAGHGEGKPAKILGSGDAAKSNQEFTLEVEEVSFTPDATKSSGVAAAIEVEVAGRVWEQVSTLNDSAPGDHHYAVRMTEEGYVKILFGEGQFGRRLPSGKNNIRVRYRVGSGLTGNVPAGSLEKPVNPHPLIKTVLQPLPATGGGDMENVASLRENAPSTLLALERAVSLADFSHLAAAQSSVWQAKAYSQILHGGRTETVKVVIVPAGGVQSPEINETTRSFLQKHALPGVQVTAENFIPVLFDLKVTVRVKTDEFVAEEVEKAVASALVGHFTLKNRKLGEHLYLSEVYKIVEGVKGVENSKCDIFEQPSESDVSKGKKALQVIRAENESTVVYLDTDADENPSTLTVTVEAYLP